MHSGTIDPCFRLRHKRSMKTMASGDRLDRHLEGHDIICCGQCICILQIDLMLSRSNLMMRGLDLKSHLFQIQHDIPAHIFCHIDRTHIKISRHLVRLGSRFPFLICLKQEKFTLWPHQKSITHISSFFQYPFQHKTRISLKRFPARPVYITDQTCHLPLLGPPRKNLQCAQIRV